MEGWSICVLRKKIDTFVERPKSMIIDGEDFKPGQQMLKQKLYFAIEQNNMRLNVTPIVKKEAAMIETERNFR